MNVPLPRFVPKGATYRDAEEKRDLESRNGYIQAAFVVYTAQNWTPDTYVTPELLCELQRLAVNQIYRCAGFFRDGPALITNRRTMQRSRVTLMKCANTSGQAGISRRFIWAPT